MHTLLQSNTIFIDTCIYRNNNFCLDNYVFTELRKLSREGKLHMVTTTITQREIEGLIKEHAIKAFAGLQEFRFKTHILSEMHVHFGAKYNALTQSQLEDMLNGAMADYYRETHTKVLPIPENCVQSVFDKYFGTKKPFKAGDKKKHEFPDAFVVEAINQSKLITYVVSADGDFSDTSEYIIHLPSLGEFLDCYNQYTNHVTEHVHKLVRKNQALIVDRIQELANLVPAYVAGGLATIDSCSVHILDVSDVLVISIKNNTAIVMLNVVFQVEGLASGYGDYEFINGYTDFRREFESQVELHINYDIKEESFFELKYANLEEGLKFFIELD